MNPRLLVVPLALGVVPALVFVALFGLSVATATQAAQGSCNSSSVNTGPSPSATAGGVTLALDSGSKKLTLDQQQLNNAATIVATGQAMNVPEPGLQTALMVGLAESTLRNLANTTVPESLGIPNDGTGHDHDSVGVFQQRANWGTVQNRMTVSWSAQAFFGGPTGPNHGSPRGLLDIGGWQSMTAAVAAQTVQVSAVSSGSNYAKYQTASASLLSYLDTNDIIPNCSSMGVNGKSWVAPNGKSGADLVAFAQQFVGKVPYTAHCGASGNPTVGWCCTGFVYYVYSAVLGIQVPGNRVSQQLTNFHEIPQSQAQAGDVVGWPDQHVGIYDGKGGVIHSPNFGRMTDHNPHLFTVQGETAHFYRANALGSGSW